MVDRYRVVLKAHNLYSLKKDSRGSLVMHSDYAALEAECARLREKIGRLTSDPIEPIEGGPT